MKLREAHGFSLVEVLIAMATLSTVILGSLYLAATTQKAMKATRLLGQSGSIINELRSVLSVTTICQSNFGGLTLSSDAVSPNGGKIVDQTASTVFTLGAPRAGEQVTLSSATMTGFVPFDPAVPLEGSTQFQVTVENPGSGISTWTVPAYVEVNASNVIQKCIVKNWQRPIWDGTSGSLAYMGKVGIGTQPNITDALAIHGELDFAPANYRHMQINADGGAINIHNDTSGNLFCLGVGDYRFEYHNTLWLTYGTGSAFGFGLATPISLLIFGDDAQSKILRFDTADAAKSWTFDQDNYHWIADPDDPRMKGGVNLMATDPSQQLGIQSRMVVGSVDGGLDFYVDGKAGGQGAWTVLSDARLKKEIRDLPQTLGMLDRIQGVHFRWRDTQRETIGFVAQDLARELPGELKDIINRDQSGWKVSYSEMIPILTKALQEIAKENASILADTSAVIAKICKNFPTDGACVANTN